MELELELGLELAADPLAEVELELEPQPATVIAAITASKGDFVAAWTLLHLRPSPMCAEHTSNDRVFAL